MNCETIEQKLVLNEPIRLKGLLKNRTETVEEFLSDFFTKWNEVKPTIYVKSKAVQTDEGKRRSLEDIYLITKYYYPKVKLVTVVSFLGDEAFDEVPRFRSSYCSMMNKRAFYMGSTNAPSAVYNKTKLDEWGNDWSFYNDNMSEDDDDE